MAKIAYKDFKKKVLRRIWPNSDPDAPGPENLWNSLEAFVQSGLAAVYQYNTCLQEQNFNVVPQCATYYRCGLSILPNRPDGVIRRLWTVAGNLCAPFTYVQRSAEEVRAWATNLQTVMTQTQANPDFPPSTLPPLPLGFQYPSPATDSKYGRALSGVWAFDDSRILVAPWIQSDESVVIEWSGTKNTWADDDLVPSDITFEDAVTFFVQMSYERDFGCNMERMTMFKTEHESVNADLLWDCREKTQLRATPVTVAEGQAAWEAYMAGETEPPPAPAVPTAPVVVAFIADYGNAASGNNPPHLVAETIKSWLPAAIITGGDNNYPSGGADTINRNVGGLYRAFIHPFNGDPVEAPLWPGELDATVNKFWPALGNHDWDGKVGADAGQPYFDYFQGVLPNDPKVGQPGQPRFYEVVLGPMHFFILNSGYDTAKEIHEPLGLSSTSLQATWLEERVALSTAPFKIAVLHHAPYTSVSNYTPGQPMLRWPFNALGLDLVLSGHGHCYERLAIAEDPTKPAIPYIVAGTGGMGLVLMGTPLTGSLVRIDSQFGAVRLTADCSMMTVDFWGIVGQTALLDSITILG